MGDGVRHGCIRRSEDTARREVAMRGEELWQEGHRLLMLEKSSNAAIAREISLDVASVSASACDKTACVPCQPPLLQGQVGRGSGGREDWGQLTSFLDPASTTAAASWNGSPTASSPSGGRA
jgi:hypothetical protein